MPVRPFDQVGLAACALSLAPILLPTASRPALTITIHNLAFQPATAHIQVGQTISWNEQDTVPHDATSVAGPVRFKSPMLTTGKSWQHTFTEPGTYHYICSIHPTMAATIVVSAPAKHAHTAAQARAATHPPTAPPPAQAPEVQTAAPVASTSPLQPLLSVFGLIGAGFLLGRTPAAVRAGRRRRPRSVRRA